MRDLRENWDGYGAAPPTPAALDFGEHFVDVLVRRAVRANGGRTDFPLYVAPARDGGVFVQLELPPLDLEFDIGPDLALGYLRTNTATGEQEERQFDPPPARTAPDATAVLAQLLPAA
jgi:hypothetical protein